MVEESAGVSRTKFFRLFFVANSFVFINACGLDYILNIILCANLCGTLPPATLRVAMRAGNFVPARFAYIQNWRVSKESRNHRF